LSTVIDICDLRFVIFDLLICHLTFDIRQLRIAMNVTVYTTPT